MNSNVAYRLAVEIVNTVLGDESLRLSDAEFESKVQEVLQLLDRAELTSAAED
jgi:hypothetical protein